MSAKIPSTDCPLLQLPTELRLLIYSFALLDTPAITIGTAELVGSHADIIHRLYSNHRSPFPGIPRHHEPVIDATYNSSLLSLTHPSIIPLPPAVSLPPEQDPRSYLHYSPHLSLQLANKQIYNELRSHFRVSANRRTSLFVAFPHGLHVLKTAAPLLLRQARSLHIAGVYNSRTFHAGRGACLPLGPQKQQHLHPQLGDDRSEPDCAVELSTLITALFGPAPTHAVQCLELRIYYPGPDSYSTVWGDDNSPTVVALRSIYTGEVGIEVWRGQRGTGVYLSARRGADGPGGRKRVVSTVWRRLEEGGRGEPAAGSWVVDPNWPSWGEGSEVGEGEGIVVSESM